MRKKNKRNEKANIEMNENKNIPYQNLRDTTKALLRGKCITQMLTLEKGKRLK